MFLFHFPKDSERKWSVNYIWLTLIIILFSQVGCKKLVQISDPTNTITTNETFNDSIDAASAIMGVYSKLVNTRKLLYIANGGATVYCGLSSDELINFASSSDITQFYTNTLNSNNTFINAYFWIPAYSCIYQANACIEGLSASKGINQNTKDQFIGEAKFIRAFLYFYLTNLFGDVPYITSTDFNHTSGATRTPQSQIYQAIINDLKDAQNSLPADYSYSGGARTRANAMAATALLARVYLYQKQWSDAETQASKIIGNSNTFNLTMDLNQIFQLNSSETILQWQLNTAYDPYNATTEGVNLITRNANSAPYCYLSPQLLNAFETGDQRKAAWMKSTKFAGKTYYYPYKYKIGPTQKSANADPTEYYMILRLAEQYLIRAEARAHLNRFSDARADIDSIRLRAGLSNTTAPDDADSVLAAVAQERKIELFAEWGHRWLDLKRTGQADATLKQIKPGWAAYQQLYPIPQSELVNDPRLSQNSGY